MIILPEEPNSPNERSPLKGGSESAPSSPPPPPPTYAATVAAPPAHTAYSVPNYNSMSHHHHPHHPHHPHHSDAHPEGGRHHSHSHSHHDRWSPSRRGRGHGGRRDSPHGGRGRSRSSSPHRRLSSPTRRFLRTFAIALLIIILWGMFLDSLGQLVGSRRVGRSVIFDGSQWLSSLYRYRDINNPIATPSPCPCRNNDTGPLAGVPGRVMPIQYPPVVNKAPEVSVLALPASSGKPNCQNSGTGSSQVPAATPIPLREPTVYTSPPQVEPSSLPVSLSRRPTVAGFSSR